MAPTETPTGDGPSFEEEPPAEYFDEPYDDGPPPDMDYDDQGYDGPPDDFDGGARNGNQGHSKRKRGQVTGASDKVLLTLRKVIAASHNRDVASMRELVSQIRLAEKVMAELDDKWNDAYLGLLEVLEVECSNLAEGSVFDLTDLPSVENHADIVGDEFNRIIAIVTAGDAPVNPAALWFALTEDVQARHTRRGLDRLAEAIDKKAPAEHKLELYKEIEPPTTKASVVRERGVRTAREVIEDHHAAQAGMAPIRFSSGLWTLDYSFTGPGEALGFIAPGEQCVLGGPTGTGKSSFSYTVVRAMAQDMVNWGLVDGKVVFFHTEEESHDKAAFMGLGPGQRFHHLADNIVVDAIGSSRVRMAEVLYDLVIDAHKKSQQNGQSITRYLPQVFVLDYIQAVSETSEDPNKSGITTAEFILRGVQAWNPEEMAKYSGLDFRTYAGMAWPEGMENHRVAALTFAQLKKPQDENALYYKKGGRNVSLSDFALEHTGAGKGWRGPDEQDYGWEVKENDFRIFKKNMIEGPGRIMQNATTIILLHRSRPTDNPKVPGRDADGREHLLDTRARLIFDKARAGSAMLFAPMFFDIMPDGRRAQYYDVAAETAIQKGLLNPDPIYREYGDPILPIRPVASPLAGVRY